MQANHLINIAPKHVLQMILKHIYDDSRPDLSLEAPYINCTAQPCNAKSFLVVTHVCRRLRHEAQNNPSLWSYIHVGGHKVEQIKTYLERSKGAPLDVEIISTPANVEDVKRSLAYLEPHAPRIQNLLIKLSCSDSMDHILPLLSRLRDVTSLRIQSFPHRVVLTRPSQSESNHLHHLQTLQLSCVLPSPELHTSFANVSNLHLQWSDYSPYPTWEEFIAFVLSIPILRVLTIIDYEWANLPPFQNAITFPYLESIELSLTKETSLQILSAFDLSTLSRISLTCKNYHISSPIILPSHLLNAAAARISNIQITSTPSSISFSAIVETEQTNISQQLDITLILVHAKGGPRRTWIGRIIQTWIESAPFNNAQYTHVSLGDELDDIDAMELDEDIVQEL